MLEIQLTFSHDQTLQARVPVCFTLGDPGQVRLTKVTDGKHSH